MIFNNHDLVLYKYRPAIIQSVGEKFDIVFQDGKTRKVREKDIALLAKGPILAFSKINQVDGDLEEAWELLQGQTVEFRELTDLIFGEVTPSTALATWDLLLPRNYFKFNGSLLNIEVVSENEFKEEEQKRLAKEQAEARWELFIDRLKNGVFDESAREFYQTIEQVAYSTQKKNRALQALKIEQTPENAHRLLLKMGFWKETHNPYPRRFGLPSESPQIEIAPLPEESRRDLTHLDAYAIDDEGNKDPDDAISLDGETFWVHVADCAALVPIDSELDQIAKERISNQYLPEKITTMLPESLVGVLGLGLTTPSPALSFALKLDEQGDCTLTDIVPSWVNVQRVSYGEVESIMSQEPFASIHQLTSKFRQKRESQGATKLRLPEVKVKVDTKNDYKVAIKPLPALSSRDMVTDSMLMAGEAIARYCETHNLAIPYATQQLNPSLDTDEEPLDGLAGMFASRKKFRRSQMTTAAGPHAGLGMNYYTRATSPMRRYLDLVVHQQLRSFIAGEKPLDHDQILERVALSESVSGSISQSERATNMHWKLVYLLQNPEWQGEGIVVDEFKGRYTILIPELALDVKVKVRDSLTMNEKVKVSIIKINLPDQLVQVKIEKEA
jgi:exoribonuclease-2